MQRELESFCRERRSLFYPKADLAVADGELRALGTGGNPAGLTALVAGLVSEVLGETPSAVAPLSEAGTFHQLYRATVAGGNSLIVRLNALSHVGHDYLLHLDGWAAGRLRAAGLPALRVHAVDLSRWHGPYDFEILEEAHGTSLKALDGDEERLLPLLTALGRFVARMHGITTRGYGFFDVGPLVRGEPPDEVRGLCPAWRDYVLCRLEDHIAACVAIGAIDAGEARRIGAAFRAWDGLLDDVQPVLLHGDLGSHNVFTEAGDVTALIDWEDALSGDAAFDVAFWATFHPERRHAAFLHGYRSECLLPADFGRRFWLYFLRVALSKTVLRHRLGLTNRSGRPPASRRIQLGLERVEALQRTRALAA